MSPNSISNQSSSNNAETAGNSQRVLVTAGANGIGKAIALAFAAAGAKVHICDIDTVGLKNLCEQVPTITASICDMNHRTDIQRMLEDTIHNLGGLDVLVNNAGIPGPSASVADMPLEAWESVLRVNLTGTFNVTQLAIPYLKQSAGGSIIVLSSLAGRFGYPNRSPYSTTKWGLIGLTKTLSRELGEFGIRVNAIMPGAVEGPRLRKVFEGRASISGRSVEEEAAEELKNQSLKRFVDPKDIAALAIFLASDSGRSISGQMLPMDGDAQRAG